VGKEISLAHLSLTNSNCTTMEFKTALLQGSETDLETALRAIGTEVHTGTAEEMRSALFDAVLERERATAAQANPQIQALQMQLNGHASMLEALTARVGMVERTGGPARLALSDSDEDDEDEEGLAGAPTIPMPGRHLITLNTLTSLDSEDHRIHDGNISQACFANPKAMIVLRDGSILIADKHAIRMISPDLSEVGTVAGGEAAGFQDGAALQSAFDNVVDFALLADDRVLIVDQSNHCIRLLSADLQAVSTVSGGTAGCRSGSAADAQFRFPAAIETLPGGSVLVADGGNARVRMLSANLQDVSTVAGGQTSGYRDGAAIAQARFHWPCALELMPDGRVLIADTNGNRIRMLSADLQHVSTVAGNGERGHRDGLAAMAQLGPSDILCTPDGRMLILDHQKHCIRALSADLQRVTTVTGDGTYDRQDGPAADAAIGFPNRMLQLPDGRILVTTQFQGIRVIAGFPPNQVSKPAAKVPKAILMAAEAVTESSASSSASATGTTGAAAAPSVLGKRNRESKSE
jgi:hypothetical protein